VRIVLLWISVVVPLSPSYLSVTSFLITRCRCGSCLRGSARCRRTSFSTTWTPRRFWSACETARRAARWWTRTPSRQPCAPACSSSSRQVPATAGAFRNRQMCRCAC
jgi:hypothetical protein